MSAGMIACSRWRRGSICASHLAVAVLAVLAALAVVQAAVPRTGTGGRAHLPPRAAALPPAVPGAAAGVPRARPVPPPGDVVARAPGIAGPAVLANPPGSALGAGAVAGDRRASTGAAGSRRDQWLFGLALPGTRPDEVRFAQARKEQPGGPETARAAAPGPYVPLALAPGAELWLTAPLADPEPTDYVRGVRVSPDRFGDLYRAAQQRLGGTVADRAHMFELWLDGQGRILRMRHYFSP